MSIYTKEQFLAFELASALKDKEHFGFYCKLAKSYSQGFLRKVLADCQEKPNWPKVKNKGAYFTKMFGWSCWHKGDVMRGVLDV